MEQHNAHDGLSGFAGRRPNSTLDGYKQILFTIALFAYIGGWSLVLQMTSAWLKVGLVVVLVGTPLALLHLWLTRRFSR